MKQPLTQSLLQPQSPTLKFRQQKIVLTGGNSGIGLQTVKALYGEGHYIIFGSRDQTKNAQAVQQIKSTFPQSKGTISAYKLDLSLKKSIQQFAIQVEKKFQVIDILINNAGMAIDQAKLSELGYEFTMTVNHFGHFYLTYLLFDKIVKSQQARIINISSVGHYRASNDIFSDLQLKKQQKLSAFNRYCDSKFANVLFTIGLNDKLQKYPSIKTVCLHPGIVSTNFGSQTKLFQRLRRFKCLSWLCCGLIVEPQDGAFCTLFLCRKPFMQLRSGQYYNNDGNHKQMDQRARNKQIVQKLWKMSQKSYNITFDP